MDKIIPSLIADFCKEMPKPLHVHEPRFVGKEEFYVQECIRTGWVSTAGPFVDRFEALLSSYTGLHVVATVNGTAALHLCYLLSGVRKNEEVFTPSLTFIATANALAYLGAVPHFVDCENISLGIDVPKLREYIQSPVFEKLEDGLYNRDTGRKVRAMVAMHVFGMPSDMQAMSELCKEYNLILIEDAAEALGSFYQGKHVGSHGLLSALSFNGNKIITTGGGGAVLTSSLELARKAKHFSTTARTNNSFQHWHDEIGYNYRLPNINAALGVAQMESLDTHLQKKRGLASAYKNYFQSNAEVEFLQAPTCGTSNCWLNTIRVPSQQERDYVLTALAAQDIHCRAIWAPLHKQPMYQSCPRMDLSVAEDNIARCINLPSSAFLADYL